MQNPIMEVIFSRLNYILDNATDATIRTSGVGYPSNLTKRTPMLLCYNLLRYGEASTFCENHRKDPVYRIHRDGYLGRVVW